MLSIWFGNFFEPFFSDREKVRQGIADVAELGFTTINLDSKPWEDFFARYRGGAASPYVAMQEFMMHEAGARGLDYTHLALYLCGDNLYPAIRNAPPVRGEESVLPNGELMGTYKYWSPRAHQTMVDHVRGLLGLYGKGMGRRAGRIIMVTMWDPIPKPSFDPEGRQCYLAWLEKRYDGDITRINQRYGISAESFGEMEPSQYWLRPGELNWVDCARPTVDDFAHRTPDFHRWIDNQTWLASEMEGYFATMKRHWRELDPALFIEPVLHQWGYFFNPPGHAMWQTGQRALDVYRVAPHVDGALFIAAPLNAENRADATALSVEGSIMRGASAGRPFTGGLFLGRHVNGDIYNVVSPAESIGTLVANGATALYIYGYSGLDDGGVMFRMDDVFKDSLRAGNRWAAEVMPLLDQPRPKEVAMLFPAEMSLYEPLEVDTGGRHRMDLLGWYMQFVDLGYHVDILHPAQIADGALADYKYFVVPHNSLYDVGDNTALEAAVKSFIAEGGTMFHGPHCELARCALGMEEDVIPFDCIKWDEEIIPHGWSTVAYRGGTALGTYIQSGANAIAQTNFGAGRVFSFGFQYGYSYSRHTMPIVPPGYGRREMHPVVLLEKTPVTALVGPSPQLPGAPIKGVEFARFGKQLIIVNHRSSPMDLSGIPSKRTWPQVPSSPGWLAAHSAICLELCSQTEARLL